MPIDDDVDDDRLLESGDLAAVLARHYADLRTYCRSRLRDRERGDELANAVVIYVGERVRAGQRWDVPFRSVLFTRAYYMAIEWHRPGPEPPYPPEWLIDAVGNDGSDPYGDWTMRHDLGVLFTGAGLTERETRVMCALYVIGLSPEQAAAQLGMTRNNIDQAAFQARAKIRSYLKRHG